MSERDDGGPAFPGAFVGNYGMSVRDYFAANALSNLILSRMEATDADHAAPSIAEEAYQIADAMLKERAK